MLKGELTISRAHNTRQTFIVIDLADGEHQHLLHIDLTPEQLALALTGQAAIPCDYEFTNPAAIGKQRKIKFEEIEVARAVVSAPELRQIALSYEVDGWQAQINDLTRFEAKRRDVEGQPHFFITLKFVRYISKF